MWTTACTLEATPLHPDSKHTLIKWWFKRHIGKPPKAAPPAAVSNAANRANARISSSSLLIPKWKWAFFQLLTYSTYTWMISITWGIAHGSVQRIHAGHETEPVDAVRCWFQVRHGWGWSCAAGAAERGETQLAVRVASEKGSCKFATRWEYLITPVGSITARVCWGL